jgi:hypothetical protein
VEAARRPALREVAEDWTQAYLDTIGGLLERAGSSQPHDDAELLLAAADGLLITQLATGHSADLQAPLVRLGRSLVGTS